MVPLFLLVISRALVTKFDSKYSHIKTLYFLKKKRYNPLKDNLKGLSNKMKKTYFFKFIIISVIALSLFGFVKTIYDNDEPVYDMLCINNTISSYVGLLTDTLLMKSAFYEHHNNIIYFEPIISYLARQEKSPPLIMPTVMR